MACGHVHVAGQVASPGILASLMSLYGVHVVHLIHGAVLYGDECFLCQLSWVLSIPIQKVQLVV